MDKLKIGDWLLTFKINKLGWTVPNGLFTIGSSLGLGLMWIGPNTKGLLFCGWYGYLHKWLIVCGLGTTMKTVYTSNNNFLI